MSLPHRLRVLVLQPAACLSHTITAAMESSFDLTADVVVVRSLDEAAQHLQTTLFDVMLCDHSCPLPEARTPTKDLHRQHPSLPILAFEACTASHPVARGATDDLHGDPDLLPLEGPPLTETLRHRLRDSRVVEVLTSAYRNNPHEREMLRLQRLAEDPGAPVTGRMYGRNPLRESDDSVFAECVTAYSEILDSTIDEYLFLTTSPRRSAALQTLANKVGFMRGTPRDIVEVHCRAMRTRLSGCASDRAQAYLDEGRILLLELMGCLVSYYRRYYSGHSERSSVE